MAGGFAVSDIDIVTRLRMPWEGMGEMANAERAEAADEIERLRGILDVQNEQVQHYVAERDEARREVCRFAGNHLPTMRIEAVWRGWDCFKEAP
jgi:hypothetical protein